VQARAVSGEQQEHGLAASLRRAVGGGCSGGKGDGVGTRTEVADLAFQLRLHVLSLAGRRRTRQRRLPLHGALLPSCSAPRLTTLRRMIHSTQMVLGTRCSALVSYPSVSALGAPSACAPSCGEFGARVSNMGFASAALRGREPVRRRSTCMRRSTCGRCGGSVRRGIGNTPDGGCGSGVVLPFVPACRPSPNAARSLWVAGFGNDPA